MDKKLYWVNLDIGINATNEQDAIDKVHKILAEGINIDYNYMVHKAEQYIDATTFTLEQLRKEQDKKKKERV
jgi:hypothetical protein